MKIGILYIGTGKFQCQFSQNVLIDSAGTLVCSYICFYLLLSAKKMVGKNLAIMEVNKLPYLNCDIKKNKILKSNFSLQYETFLKWNSYRAKHPHYSTPSKTYLHEYIQVFLFHFFSSFFFIIIVFFFRFFFFFFIFVF